MSWLSDLVKGKPQSMIEGMTGWGEHWGREWRRTGIEQQTAPFRDSVTREFRRNVEFPWKSGYRVGSEKYGTLGGILGGVIRMGTDWFFQTGPGSGDNPAWSTEPGAEVVMTDEEKNNAGIGDTDTGTFSGGGEEGEEGKKKKKKKKKKVEEEDKGEVTDATANTGDGTDITDKPPAASQALAALMRRRMKMRRGRSSTVLTGGARIGRGDKKTMAYA